MKYAEGIILGCVGICAIISYFNPGLSATIAISGAFIFGCVTTIKTRDKKENTTDLFCNILMVIGGIGVLLIWLMLAK